jgi:hypothetical protein
LSGMAVQRLIFTGSRAGGRHPEVSRSPDSMMPRGGETSVMGWASGSRGSKTRSAERKERPACTYNDI